MVRCGIIVAAMAGVVFAVDPIPTAPPAPQPKYTRIYPDSPRVLDPQPPGIGSDREILTYSAGRLNALNASSGQNLWRRTFSCPVEPVYLGDHEKLSLFSTRHRVFAVRAQSGEIAWEYGDEPPADVLSDPEFDPGRLQVRLADGALYIEVDQKRLERVDCANGRVIWAVSTKLPPKLVIAANGERFCYLAKGEASNFAVVADTATGKTLRRYQSSILLSEVAFDMPTSEALIAWSGRAIECIGLANGQSRWSADIPPPQFVSGTQISGEALYGATPASIQKFRMSDGVLTRVFGLGTRNNVEAIWMRRSTNALYVAADNALFAADATGPIRDWARKMTDVLEVQFPILTNDAIVIIRRHQEATRGAAQRYSIEKIDPRTGANLPVCGRSELITEPIASFRGLFVRENTVVLLDGQTLIGYVDPPGGAQDQE